MTNTELEQLREEIKELIASVFVAGMLFQADRNEQDVEDAKRTKQQVKEQLLALFQSHEAQIKQELKGEIVKEYGDFRKYEKGKKYSKTLRFYLLPHTEHNEEDGESDV